jgi:very-short-patch-repair endonuclease
MLSSSHPAGEIMIQGARDRGWNVTNTGEAEVARALRALGYAPESVECQFRLGPYRLDFALPAQRIDIEADGWVHTSKPVRARDRERDRTLREWGWTVIRVHTDQDVDAQLRRHLPDATRIDGYGQTLRQITALVELQISRLHRYGMAASPADQLEWFREALRDAAETTRRQHARQAGWRH